jgi:uncharacterized protein YcfJ
LEEFMKSFSAIFGACLVLAVVAVGCDHPRSRTTYVRDEAPVVTTTTTTDYRRRPDETVFEVPITSVHAIVGPEEKRCWIERDQISGPNVGGAIAGAVIGGILGHQIGAGRGRDAATVGGAAVGGAIGANAGSTYPRDVERCETTASASPDYWDITYDFRGVEHHVQMTYPPGSTITVNRFGEPRV